MSKPIFLIAAAALACLAGCGSPQSGTTNSEHQSLAETLACGPSSQGMAAAVCANPTLAALDTQVREALVAQSGNVSDSGAQLLAQGQRRWLDAQGAACGVLDASTPLNADQTRCLESKLRERIREARGSVREEGGYVFQSVELVNALPVTAQAAEAVGLSEADAPNAIVRDIRYPRIDNAATPQAQRFNELVRQEPQYQLTDQVEEQVSYRIVYAGPQIISVRFDTYENSLGAAHPETGARAVTILMTGEGRAIAASDVFRDGARWEEFVTQRSMTALTQQFRQYDFRPPIADVRETATKAHNWLITADGLTILFAPYSFGGPFAFGGAEVTIPWADLRSFLNPSAPAPIAART